MYEQLVRVIPAEEVKVSCFTVGIISRDDMEIIASKSTTTEKNEAILRIVSRSSDQFGKFREVLHHVDVCSTLARSLDKIGPRRDQDEGK